MDGEKRRKRLDGGDILTFCGLVLAGVGLWMRDPALALTVVGAVVFGLGLIAAWSRRS